LDDSGQISGEKDLATQPASEATDNVPQHIEPEGLGSPSNQQLTDWLAKSGIRQSPTPNSQLQTALSSDLSSPSSEQGVRLVCWGSGSPYREFLYSDDLAEACVFLLENAKYEDLAFEDESGTVQSHINVGSGSEITIRELAETVKDVVGYEGKIEWDSSKPDGTPRKLMDSSRLRSLGWAPEISLAEGIARAYEDFKDTYLLV
jgi:nucleoside-diphosphate-sugar epimerase